MKNHILLSLLRSLKSSELKKCKKYLQVHFNVESDYYKLFCQLEKNSFQNIPFDHLREELYSRSATDKYIQNKFSLLKKEIENFMISDYSLEDYSTNRSIYHEVLLRKGLVTEASKVRKSMFNENINDKINPFSHFYALHKISHDAYFSDTEFKYKIGDELITQAQESLFLYQNFLDHYYTLERTHRSNLNLFDKSPSDSSLNDISEKTQISTELLRLLIRTIKGNSSLKSFEILLEKLISDSDYYPKEIRIVSYQHLEQYAINRIKEGHLEYINQLFRVFDNGLKLNLYLYRGNISARRFGNFIDLSCACNKLEWGEETLSKYIEKVDRKDRKSVEKVSLIQLAFAKNKFNNCLEELNEFKPKIIDHKLRKRWYTICCLYKLDLIDLLDNALDSFRIYLLRNIDQLSKATHEGLKNFIKIMTMLMNNKNKENILQKFNSMKNIIFRLWLLKQIEGLSK